MIRHTTTESFFGSSTKALSWYLKLEYLGSGTGDISGYVHVLARYDNINDDAINRVKHVSGLNSFDKDEMDSAKRSLETLLK